MKKGFRILKFKKDKPIFEIKDVSKSFDGRPILKKLSLIKFKPITPEEIHSNNQISYLDRLSYP